MKRIPVTKGEADALAKAIRSANNIDKMLKKVGFDSDPIVDKVQEDWMRNLRKLRSRLVIQDRPE